MPLVTSMIHVHLRGVAGPTGGACGQGGILAGREKDLRAFNGQIADGKATVWLQPLGIYGKIQDVKAFAGGAMVGVQYNITPEFTLGMTGGYMTQGLKTGAPVNKRTSHGGLFGPILGYAECRDGAGLTLSQVVLGNVGQFKDRRDVEFSTLKATSKATHAGVTSGTEVAYGLRLLPRLVLAPVAMLNVQYLSHTARNEKGAEESGLQLPKMNFTVLSPQGGLRLTWTSSPMQGQGWVAELTATCVTHQHMQQKKEITLDFVDLSNSFVQPVTRTNSVLGNVQAALSYKTGPKGWNVGLTASGQMGKKHTAASVMVTAGYTF